jgi:integrase
MKFSFPKKDGPVKGRKAPWQLNLSHEGKLVRKFFSTRDLRANVKKRMNQALLDGRFAEEFPTEARNLGFTEQRQGAVKLKDALERFLDDASQRKIAKTTIKTWRQQIGKFHKEVGNTTVEKVTRQMATAYIEGYRTEGSRTSIKNALVNFLSWCGEDGQGFCPRAKFHGLTWRRIRGAKPKPTFLPVEEASAILQALELRGKDQQLDAKRTKQLQAAYAVALFIGVRPMDEMNGLLWDHFDLRKNQIHISAEIAKTNDERLVSPIPENLKEWLKRAKYRKGDSIRPMNYRNWRTQIKKARKEAEVETWCDDVARHTFATYSFQHFGLEWTMETGGWTNPNTLFKHYKGLATKEEAEAFYSILPLE